MKFSIKFTMIFLTGIAIMFSSSCKKEEETIDLTGTYVNQTDNCVNNGYILNVTPLGGNEFNITGLHNEPSLIIVGKVEGNNLTLVTTTFPSNTTVAGGGVLVDDILTINYTASNPDFGSEACTGIFNK